MLFRAPDVNSPGHQGVAFARYRYGIPLLNVIHGVSYTPCPLGTLS